MLEYIVTCKYCDSKEADEEDENQLQEVNDTRELAKLINLKFW